MFVGSTPTPVGGGAGLSCTTTTKNVAGGTMSDGNPDPTYGCWPGASNIGIPAGTSLTTYSGSCDITTNNTVIDSKTVNCGQLTISALNVQIKNSRVNGYPFIDDANPTTTEASFSITDSVIANPSAADNTESIGKSHFSVLRTDVSGGRRGIFCEYDCSVADSYIHGQEHGVLNCTTAGCAWHEAGWRLGSGNGTSSGVQTFTHNTVVCDAPDIAADEPGNESDTSGCSASQSGYGDFAPIQNNTVTNNLYPSTPGGTCAYLGNTAGTKPFPGGHPNVFTNNIFVKDPSTGHCGFFFSTADFNSGLSGNVFSNNKLWTASTSSSVALNPNE